LEISGRQKSGLDTRSAGIFATEPDERRIALAQSLRITLVVALVPPLVLSLSPDHPEASVPLRLAETFAPWQGAGLALGAGLGLILARRLRLPAPELTGPMLVSATLYLTGWVDYHLPTVLLSATLWVLGSAVGVRFKEVKVAQLLRLGRHALGAVVLALMVAAAFAALIAQLPGVDYLPALLALSPGGIAEMCLIAVAWNIDPAFVAFHHLARMLMVIALAPWLGRLLDKLER
ncbi:MAG: AbrB family transcriptional regulator, partial [Candidatus Competibacteraceae bacterium]|nr:AbrB family transcriptional regulator [Candidatus Competibacteraceae bacterium]